MASFNKEKMAQLRADLNSVLSGYGIHNDLKFEIGNITFDDASFRTTLKAFSTANGVNPEKIEFEKNCFKFGIDSNWYGKIVEIKGIHYKISAIKTRAKKYPIVLTPSKGATVGLVSNVSTVRNALLLTEKE